MGSSASSAATAERTAGASAIGSRSVRTTNCMEGKVLWRMGT
ncbi:hypothetical protein ACLESO_37335 [Pyxidicoccus sp. 3LG]